MSPPILYLGASLFLAEATAIVFNPAPSNASILEGETATLSCRPEVNGSLVSAILWTITPIGGNDIVVNLINTTVLPGASGVFRKADGTQIFITGVQRSLHRARVRCRGRQSGAQELSDAYILVQVPPRFFLPVSSSERVEGQSLSIRLEDVDIGTDDASVSVLFWDKILTEGNGFSVTRSGASWTILIPAVYRNDTGVVRVVLGNTHGSATANFTLNVIYPPEFTGVASVRSVQLRNGSLFTFNCTPSDANPSSVTYSFRRNGTILSVSGSVLNISSVVRGDSGNYSCTAANSAGSTTVYYGLLVVAPPTEPQTVTVPQVTPFSSTISWTPPTDDGGISSPSWTPPSPHSSTGLTYHVTYSNSSGSWTSKVNSTQSMLVYLQHSTDYTVSVVAENVYGRSAPSGEIVFRTSDSRYYHARAMVDIFHLEPIVDRITLTTLGLTNFTANITFLTVGGQTVTSFKIMVNDLEKTDTTQVTDGKLKTVSLVVVGLSLTKGTDYSVSVTATNSIGESEPVMGTLTVPNPPSITAPPTELPPNSTSCCSGVKLNLARPQDVSDVRVSLSVNGGPYEMVRSGDLALTGDILYISGLQAGTVYTANIIVSNIFGSTEQQTTLKPILGRPSNPALPNVTVDGTVVTVVLSTDYPGTERTRSGSMFTFQIHFNKIGRSTRQSSTQAVPFTPLGLSTTIYTTYDFSLSAGTYTVSVSALNEHGSSEISSPSKQFVIAEPSTLPPTPNNSPAIIGAVVGGVVFVLLILIVISLCVICYMKFWRTRTYNTTAKDRVKEDCTYDDVLMSSGTIQNIQLDSNPSYQPMTIEPSVNDPTYDAMETKLQMTDSPAYEPIGLAQKTQQIPVYSNL